MSFNGQQDMFFSKIISCTCDLHLKLDILNPLNIMFLSNGFLKKVLCFITLFFKISKLSHFFMIWFFIKFIQWTCILKERGFFLLYKKIEINCMTLCIPFNSFKKSVVQKFDIVSLQDSKWHLHSNQITFKYFYLFSKTSLYLLTYNNQL
jgi:hypothetical protein